MATDGAVAADPVVSALSREEALGLTQRGGFVRCLDMPVGTAFGIDMRTYFLGERFGGIKMVPTDVLHLVTWGNDLTCCGVFLRLHAADVAIMRWNADDEALRLVSDEAESLPRVQQVLRMEHDGVLAPYPLATADEWRALAGHVSEAVLHRAGIPLGVPTAPAGIDDDELLREVEALEREQRDGSGSVAVAAAKVAAAKAAAPKTRPPSTDADADMDDGAPRAARFVTLDPRRSGVGLSGAALSRFHLDRSEWLAQLLGEAYADGGTDDERNERMMLGELQLSYVLFLRVCSLRALEQWKSLVHLLCACEEALCVRARLYANALAVLRAQLALATADVLEEGNFLRASLASLARHAHARAADIAPAVHDELLRLWESVRPLGVRVEELVADDDEEDDDEQPVVVE